MLKQIKKQLSRFSNCWIDLEVNIFSKNRDFLIGAGNRLMEAFNTPYTEGGVQKRLNRIFKSSIKEYMKYKNKKKELFDYLRVAPTKKYDLNSLQKDIKAIYTIIKDVSLASDYGWKMKYSLELNSNNDLILVQDIGFLKMSYPLSKRVKAYLIDPKADFYCFMDKSIDKIFPLLITLSKKYNNKKIENELKSIGKLLN